MGISNTLYDNIRSQYEEKRTRESIALQNRYEETYLKIPALQDLDNQLSSLSLEEAKCKLNGLHTDPEAFKQNVARIMNTRKELLEKAGLPADYLEPSFDCTDCQDTGYIGTVKCHCFNDLLLEQLFAQSNLFSLMDTENFSTFSLDYYSDSQIDSITGLSARKTAVIALNTCKSFIESFDSEFKNLFFYGKPGVGKTFLTNCIAKEIIKNSKRVLYFTANNLFDVLSKSSFDKDSLSMEISNQIMSCDLLIIDDLGTELSNTFTTKELCNIINERIISKKSTIISTNLSLDDVKSTYTERIFSRISGEYTIIHLVGDDIRIKKKIRERRK